MPGRKNKIPVDSEAIFENSLEAMIISTADGRILNANAAACKLFGMTEKEIIRTGRDRLVCIDEAERERLLREREKNSGSSHTFTLIRKDGSRFQAEVRSKLHKIEDGKFFYIILIRDLTENLNLLNKYKNAREFLERVINYAPVVFYTIDNAGFITFTAGRGFEGTDIKAGQNVGKNAYDIFGAFTFTMQDGVKISGPELLNKVMDGRSVVSMFERKGRFYSNRMAPITDLEGKQTGIVGVSVDITVRIRSDRVIAEKEANLRSLIENTNGAIWSVDKDYCLIDGNELFRKLFLEGTGIKIKTGDNAVEPLPPSIREEWRSYYRAGLEGRKFDIQTSTRPPLKVEHRRYYFNPIRTPGGEIIGVSISSENITDFVEARRMLEKTTEHLRALTLRQRDIVEHERTSIAHDLHDDLGQKLTAITLELSSIISLIENPSDSLKSRFSEVAELVSGAMESTRRISRGLRPTMIEDLGLLESLDWQINEFRKTTGIDCRLECRHKEINVSTELALSIFRIVQEALTNTARHSGADRAVVKLGQKGSSIHLYIKDYGTGIDQEKINSVYSTGLTGMKERALSNNGTLVIKGVKGQGTVVSATFRLNEK